MQAEIEELEKSFSYRIRHFNTFSPSRLASVSSWEKCWTKVFPKTVRQYKSGKPSRQSLPRVYAVSKEERVGSPLAPFSLFLFWILESLNDIWGSRRRTLNLASCHFATVLASAWLPVPWSVGHKGWSNPSAVHWPSSSLGTGKEKRVQDSISKVEMALVFHFPSQGPGHALLVMNWMSPLPKLSC